MAFTERIIFIIKFLVYYLIIKRNNLVLFFFYTIIVFTLQRLKVSFNYTIPFLMLSYFSLLNLYNEDRLICKNKLYEVLGLGKIEIHSGKLTIFFFLMLIQDIFLNYDQSLYLHFVTGLSLLISMILNINFFFINKNWIKIIIYFISFGLVKASIVSYGIIFGFILIMISSLFTVKNMIHEHNRYL